MSKPKVAFFCVHNSCRSQIAEALGKHFLADRYDFYSAGSETKPRINPDAVRLVKQLYGIDMEKTQYSKTADQIPVPDIAVSMGCEVDCPYINRSFEADWGLPDPTGQPDEVFVRVIGAIEENIKNWKKKDRRGSVGPLMLRGEFSCGPCPRGRSTGQWGWPL